MFLNCNTTPSLRMMNIRHWYQKKDNTTFNERFQQITYNYKNVNTHLQNIFEKFTFIRMNFGNFAPCLSTYVYVPILRSFIPTYDRSNF